VSLLLLEDDLLVGFAVGAPMTCSWKIMKRAELLLCGACEVVVEHAISGVEEKVAIRKVHLSSVELSWIRRRAFMASGRPSW
jgi:hypothetical protein